MVKEVNRFALSLFVLLCCSGGRVVAEGAEEIRLVEESMFQAASKEDIEYINSLVLDIFTDVKNWWEDLLNSKKRYDVLVQEFKTMCDKFEKTVVIEVVRLREQYPSDQFIQNLHSFVLDIAEVLNKKVATRLQGILISTRSITSSIERVSLFKKEFNIIAVIMESEVKRLYKRVEASVGTFQDPILKNEMQKLHKAIVQLASRYSDKKVVTNLLTTRVIYDFSREKYTA